MTVYNINEIFTSIQGEGRNAGKPATFIRAQGCPVGCPWCDSGPHYHPDVPHTEDLAIPLKGPFHVPSKGNTWPGNLGTKMTAMEIVMKIPPDIKLIVMTGGEPVLQNWDDLLNLIVTLRGNHQFVDAVETSGQYPWLGDHVPSWITVSPKWSGNRWFINDWWWIHGISELKYVVDDQFTDEVVEGHLDYMHKLLGPGWSEPDVVLMPEGCPPSKEANDKVLALLKSHPDWFFGPRLQYILGVK